MLVFYTVALEDRREKRQNFPPSKGSDFSTDQMYCALKHNLENFLCVILLVEKHYEP
jgi:hypothetical protein